MNGLATAALIGVGAAAGAIARYGVGTQLSGSVATLAVNASGSAAAGALLAADLSTSTTAIAAVGFCGAFTTFSSFAVEVADRMDRGDRVGAARYACVTLAAALLGVGVGLTVGAAVWG